MAGLIIWFQSAVLPAQPFDLRSHIEVVDPAKFRKSLMGAIGAGPAGARARTGALKAKLIRLQTVLDLGGK